MRWTKCVSQSCQMQWSSQTPSARTVVRAAPALTRNGSVRFLIKRNKDESHLINEPVFLFFFSRGCFFSLSLEVFKRKVVGSAEYRMSTLGITSNLSESTLWRGEDPLKSARVHLNYVCKELKSFLRSRNQSKILYIFVKCSADFEF